MIQFFKRFVLSVSGYCAVNKMCVNDRRAFEGFSTKVFLSMLSEICETSFSVSGPRRLILTKQDREALVSKDETETEELWSQVTRPIPRLKNLSLNR